MRRGERGRVFERRSQIEALVAIADVGSFRGGAQSLGSSQSHLSRTIGEIETKLSAKLFERRPNGVRPTIVGAVAIEQARLILLELEAADEMVGRVCDVLESGDGGE